MDADELWPLGTHAVTRLFVLSISCSFIKLWLLHEEKEISGFLHTASVCHLTMVRLPQNSTTETRGACPGLVLVRRSLQQLPLSRRGPPRAEHHTASCACSVHPAEAECAQLSSRARLPRPRGWKTSYGWRGSLKHMDPLPSGQAGACISGMGRRAFSAQPSSLMGSSFRHPFVLRIRRSMLVSQRCGALPGLGELRHSVPSVTLGHPWIPGASVSPRVRTWTHAAPEP